MKKFLLGLTLSLMLIAPVNADSLSDAAQAEFLALYSPQGLTGCNSNSDHGLTFAPNTSSVNISAITTASQTYDWTGASLKNPDIVGFFTAIATDTNLPAAARMLLPLAEPLMVQQISNPTLINTYISSMVASGQYSWLTQPVQQEIVNLAQQYNIPIVMPSTVPDLATFNLLIISNATIPPAAKLELIKYVGVLTDLISYAGVVNPTCTVTDNVTAGTNVAIPVNQVDTLNMQPGAFVVVTDGTNKDVVPIVSLATNTITVQGLAQGYGPNATVVACNLLQNGWLLLSLADAQLQVNCTDNVPLITKIEAFAVATNIPLTP